MTNHLNEKAQIRNLPKKGTQNTAILAIHGRDQEPEFILTICDRLGWDEVSTIAPKAANKTWYPGGFMLPIQDNEPDLTIALETITEKIKELNTYGFSNDQIIIMGFSQGACLASEFAARNPSRYKALIFLTGGLIGDKLRTDYSGDFQETPVFITTSKIDEWVPVSRVKETARIFEAMNAKLNMKIYTDREHEVSKDEIAEINEMISV